MYIYICTEQHLSACRSPRGLFPEAVCLKPCPFAYEWQTKTLAMKQTARLPYSLSVSQQKCFWKDEIG